MVALCDWLVERAEKQDGGKGPEGLDLGIE